MNPFIYLFIYLFIFFMVYFIDFTIDTHYEELVLCPKCIGISFHQLLPLNTIGIIPRHAQVHTY